MNEAIDVKENKLIEIDGQLLDILLKDRTTGKNILWATDNYEGLGFLYNSDKPVLPALITGEYGEVIKPRIKKTKEEQQRRIRGKAEVFTPSWVCNCQNNLVDEAWFGFKNAFNTEGEKSWTSTEDKIDFSKTNGKTWQDYVNDIRLEITCGEAPYLVSRYDTVTGKEIKVKDRIGLLDRKLRIVGENVSDKDDWIEWAKKAYQSIYGYEWQGDNLLLARENLLYTFIDYYGDKFKEVPDKKLLLEIAEIISWNIWQMDGLKFIVPKPKDIGQLTIFDVSAPHGSGKRKRGNSPKRAGIYCKIMNWKTGKKEKFIDQLRVKK